MSLHAFFRSVNTNPKPIESTKPMARVRRTKKQPQKKAKAVPQIKR